LGILFQEYRKTK